jgi:hypothetical protein
MNILGVEWREEAPLVMEQADVALYRDFDINVMVIGFRR